MKYLKKRNLYNLCVSMLSYADMPLCSHCSYSFSRGHEWLKFYTSDRSVSFCVRNCGDWIHVVEKDDEGCVIRNEVLHSVLCPAG